MASCRATTRRFAVESELQLIVGQAVTQQAKKQLLPMSDKVTEQAGQTPRSVLADSGYVSEENLRGVAKLGVEAHVAVGRRKHHQELPPQKSQYEPLPEIRTPSPPQFILRGRKSRTRCAPTPHFEELPVRVHLRQRTGGSSPSSKSKHSY